jgi:amidohydrolase
MREERCLLEMNSNELTTKNEIRRVVSRHEERLVSLSHRIHATPELGFEEEKSASWVAGALAGEGFTIEAPAFGLNTAFIATAGHGPIRLAICAEYDALPEMGHACGHNIIASSAVGAAIGLAGLADDFGLTVQVFGTPAEEAGDAGGKILLLERGAFNDVHAAMMVHPYPYDEVMPRMIAAAAFDVAYTGKEAHAAAFPELGINAADALTVAQVAIGLLRQHILPTDRVHGIITRGGDAPNVIPAHTSARYMARAERLGEVQAVRDRVMQCFEAGAVATGSALEVSGGMSPYAQVEHDHEMAAMYRRNGEKLGREFRETTRPAGSTDMGNVSLVVPTIHPLIGIESDGAVNHQPGFAACCITPSADLAVIHGAIAMAWTAVDIASDEGQRKRLVARLIERQQQDQRWTT